MKKGEEERKRKAAVPEAVDDEDVLRRSGRVKAVQSQHPKKKVKK